MSSDLEQVHQRLFVKDQEINALKVQNRHLIAKVEEAEARAKPNQINTQQITAEVHRLVQRSLTQAFEAMQGTLRGVYQQSLRAQQAVEDLAAHSRELENRVAESRKEDQVFYQDKILQTLNSLCDQIDRTVDQRMSEMSGTLAKTQNETLSDLEALKLAMSAMHRSAELTNEQIQALSQKITSHRAEFKLMRGEVRSAMENQSERVQVQDEASETAAETSNEKSEDLTLILDLLRTQKQELQETSSKAENYLKKYRAENENTKNAKDVQAVNLDPSMNEGNP
jgi:chromosome segregation ATPase